MVLSRQPINADWVENLYMLGLKLKKPHFFKEIFNTKKEKGIFLTRGPARLYLLVNQPYRCTDRTRLPALFRARFKEREFKRSNSKRGSESGEGAVSE